MKPKFYITIFALFSITAFSCKTASKLYEKGNYTEAVELAAKKLQKDPDDPKLLNIIQNAYKYAVEDHESRIRNNAESTSELKYEWMYNEYASLQRMYDAIFRVPQVFSIVKPMDYSSYLVTYAEKAGDVREQRGDALMNAYSSNKSMAKQNYRNAYREYHAALGFKRGNISIAQKQDEAYDLAVTNVVILPMQQQGGYVYSSYTVGGNNLDDQLLRNLQYNSGSEFVKFYSAWDARSQQIRVDQQLDMRLVSADIGRYDDDQTRRRVTKEVVIKETVYKPDSVVREYAKVHAEITTVRRSMHSRAFMQVSVRDEDGGWVWNDDFTGYHQWSTEFASFTGDARALSDADRQLVDRRKEFAPSDNEVMKCMLDQILNDAQYRIRNYFSRL
ncbi:MAG: hypothetical protein NTW29_04625 [Bacteroidetes bacterium]|nr:hypothetical protein [Bacteroidota bacterium]